jgi:hypothetical protein
VQSSCRLAQEAAASSGLTLHHPLQNGNKQEYLFLPTQKRLSTVVLQLFQTFFGFLEAQVLQTLADGFFSPEHLHWLSVPVSKANI